MADQSFADIVARLRRNIRHDDPPQDDGLRASSEYVLEWETVAAVNLLRHGHAVLVASTDMERDLDPILTTLAIGVEKLLKVSLGHTELAQKNGWPAKAAMRAAGHDSVELQRQVLDYVRTAAIGKPFEADALRLVAAVDSDDVWMMLLLVLSHYGKSGRFHYLDDLAGEKGLVPGSGPRGSWMMLTVAAMFKNPLADANDEDPLRQANLRRSASLIDWWSAIAALAETGALGERAVEFGRVIYPTK